MSSSDSADRRAPERRAVRLPHQDRSSRVHPQPIAPDAPQGRVVVRELRTDRPVPRHVASERHPAEAESPRPGVPRADAHVARHAADHTAEDARHEELTFPGGHERELVRRLHDERTGADWRVFERDARRVPGSRGPRCLYFDGEGVVRRVWHYPADWQSLPAAALLALMDRPPMGER